MAMKSDLQTPFADPGMASAPSGSDTGGGGTSGGFSFPDGQQETANMSGLPALPTTVSPGAGDPGIGAVIGMPPLASPGTIPTSKPDGGN